MARRRASEIEQAIEVPKEQSTKKQAKKAVAKKAQAKKVKALTGLAARFSAFKPAHQVLSAVRAVPTDFVQFDHAVRIGGFPIERVSIIHGPSANGKTTLTLGLMGSFLKRGHFAFFLDAERTTPITWVEEMLGEHARSGRFFASRPDTYEAARASVRNFCDAMIKAREAGEIDQDVSALIVVDSMRKLVPKNLMDEFLATTSASDVKGRDRSGQLKAQMNAIWMDELVPQMEAAKVAFLGIARETTKADAQDWERRAGLDYIVGGGASLIYDASLRIRVVRAGYVQHGKDGEKKQVYGERHRIEIAKSKVAGKDDKMTICYFHTSNGKLIPPGFDRARDVLELAERFEIIEVEGRSYSFRGQRIAAGKDNAVVKMTETPELLAAIEEATRDHFADVKPTEVDEDGVVS